MAGWTGDFSRAEVFGDVIVDHLKQRPATLEEISVGRVINGEHPPVGELSGVASGLVAQGVLRQEQDGKYSLLKPDYCPSIGCELPVRSDSP